MQEFFELVKQPGSATIDPPGDLINALRECGVEPSRAAVRAIKNQIDEEIDQDGNLRLDREKFFMLLFSERMSERFFMAAQSEGTTVLTVPLWSLAFRRQKNLGRYYAQFAEPEAAPERPKLGPLKGRPPLQHPSTGGPVGAIVDAGGVATVTADAPMRARSTGQGRARGPPARLARSKSNHTFLKTFRT
ncbi:hypothetical protein M885DRAFT_501987 [Pelagophyceae sp. CCMP2097]|nr:hypothetical protein M885DRAFT_501987 [Pelagophyceae sp. CCMP2097]